MWGLWTFLCFFVCKLSAFYIPTSKLSLLHSGIAQSFWATRWRPPRFDDAHTLVILTVYFQFSGRWSRSVDTIVSYTSVLTCVWSVNICDCQSVIIVSRRRSQSWIACDVQSLFIFCPYNIRCRASFNYTAKNNISSFHCGEAFRNLRDLRCNWKK